MWRSLVALVTVSIFILAPLLVMLPTAEARPPCHHGAAKPSCHASKAKAESSERAGPRCKCNARETLSARACGCGQGADGGALFGEPRLTGPRPWTLIASYTPRVERPLAGCDARLADPPDTPPPSSSR